MQGKIVFEEHMAIAETLGETRNFAGDSGKWDEFERQILDMGDERLELMDKNGIEVLITSLEKVQSEDGFEVVQIDVEPLDVYFGKTFLVHNKGSNDNPF